MRRFTIQEDVITENDPNYNVDCIALTIHNQGSTIVRINEMIFLPDDEREYDLPDDGMLEWRLRIKFLGAYPFQKALSSYPMLFNGNRLVITQMVQKGKLNGKHKDKALYSRT